jgi:hypothetical protein
VFGSGPPSDAKPLVLHTHVIYIGCHHPRPARASNIDESRPTRSAATGLICHSI